MRKLRLLEFNQLVQQLENGRPGFKLGQSYSRHCSQTGLMSGICSLPGRALLILIETGQHRKDLSKDHQCATFLPSPTHHDAVRPPKDYSDYESVAREPTQAANNRL